MGMSGYLAVALLVLSVAAEVEGSSDRAARSSAHTEPIRRRGNLSQRGRKKTIWSYNPGHRSLAFLVAGDVEVASPPPVDSVTGWDYRCLGCCGVRAPVGTTSRPQTLNRVGGLVLRPDAFAVIGWERNSVNDRCLGCCEDGTTPINGVTTVTTGGTPKVGGVMKIPITSRQRPRQPQGAAPHQKPCAPPECAPSWGSESSSSSEEIPAVRRPPSRMQPIRSRADARCRRYGCRSPLGSAGDDSSSSEED